MWYNDPARFSILTSNDVHVYLCQEPAGSTTSKTPQSVISAIIVEVHLAPFEYARPRRARKEICETQHP